MTSNQRKQPQTHKQQPDIPHGDVVPAGLRENGDEVQGNQHGCKTADSPDGDKEQECEEEFGETDDHEPAVAAQREETFHPQGNPADPVVRMHKFIDAEVAEYKDEAGGEEQIWEGFSLHRGIAYRTLVPSAFLFRCFYAQNPHCSISSPRTLSSRSMHRAGAAVFR